MTPTAAPHTSRKRVLVVGGGGREHALVWKLAQSPRVESLFASPGSDAMAQLAQCCPLDGTEAIVDFAAQERIDLTVIGPEAPLVEGLVDRMEARGLATFGPSATAARLEGSKSFAKDFMARHGIPTAAYATFDSKEEAQAYIAAAPGPFVVKADGLAAGKGVTLCEDQTAAQAAVQAAMGEQVFGQAGCRVVIEEWLPGEEASYFVISDGEHYVTLPSCQDHKPVGEQDRGPNTGGMGAYCPAPVVTPAVEQRILAQVVEPTLRGMREEGHPYRGVLYIGLMLFQGQPRVVEYNCRFGDPETQPLLLLLKSDLLELLEGRLKGVRPRWHSGAAACIVMAAGGYPGTYQKGLPISGLDSGGCPLVAGPSAGQVFHAGTRRLPSPGQVWQTAGGRVLGVTARGDSLATALAAGYRTVAGIDWPGCIYRRDIGQKGLKFKE